MFFQQVLGMCGAMVLLLLLAVSGLFHWQGVCTAVVLAMGLAWLGGQHTAVPTDAGEDTMAIWQWCALGCGVLLSVAVSWRFPGAWDDTSYHLPLARTIVEHQALVANEWLRFPYFPAFMQLLFAAGLLVDPWLAQWLATWPVVVTLMGLMGAAQWLCGHAVWGVLGWALYMGTPALAHSLGFAYVDAGLALFCMAAVVAVAFWAESEMRGARAWLVLAGACAGVAGGIKFHGLVVAAALAGAVLAMAVWPGKRRPALKSLLIYGLPCAGLSAFWYVRSYWLTGDPVHPAGASVFGYYLWTPDDLAFQLAEQAMHGVPKQWTYFLQGVWHAQVPYLYAIFGVPLLLAGRHGRAWAVVGLVLWANTLFWFWASQVDRYLMPVLPLAALLGFGVLLHMARWLGDGAWVGRWAPAGWLEALALMLMTGLGAWSVMALQQRPTLEEQRDRFGEIALLHRAEEMAAQYGDRVWNVGFENAFYFYKGQLIGDWFGPAAFRRLADCSRQCRMRSPEEVRLAMLALDTRMLLIHAGKFPFDEAQYSAHMVLLARNGAGFLYGLRLPQ